MALEVAEVFRSPTLYQFRFQLLDAVIRAESNRLLTIDGATQSTITSAWLRYATEPNPTDDDELVYTLMEPPSYGSLWVGTDQLVAGSKWTQTAISSQRLQYRLARRTLSSLRDVFIFRVVASSAGLFADQQRFEIEYTPADEPSVFKTITTGEVSVNEGETAVLQVPINNFIKASLCILS